MTDLPRRTFLAGLACTLSVPLLARSALAQRTWNARGEIRAVRAERSSLTIRHEPIADLMPAMTMPFRVARASLLEGLSVGDRVAFTISRVEGRYVIQSIRRL